MEIGENDNFDTDSLDGCVPSCPSSIETPERSVGAPFEEERLQQVDLDAVRGRIEEFVHLSDQDSPESKKIERARKTVDDFYSSKEKFSFFLFEKKINPDEVHMGKESDSVYKMAKNLSRLPKDIDRKKSIRRKIKSGELKLDEVDLKINIFDRDALIEDPRLVGLWDIEDNRDTLLNFTKKELYQEIGATHWMMITGVQIDQLHAIVESAGHNPATFFSDDRGEQHGRISINNYLKDIPIGKNDSRYEEEKEYWQPLFTNKLLPKSIRNWQTSRNHSVVFGVKDKDNNDVFLLPVHVDPKNWVVSIKERIYPSKKGERSALRYHDISKEGTESYHGTGLYDLGILLFIKLLKEKQQEIFRGLRIYGEEKLETTGTISGDNKNEVVLEEVFVEKLKKH